MSHRRHLPARVVVGIVAAATLSVLVTTLPTTRAAATTSDAATAALTSRTVDPQCSGEGYSPGAGDAQAAAALMSGTLNLAPFGVSPLTANPTWAENPFANRSWMFLYHSLGWAEPLRRTGLATGDQAMIDRYSQLWHDWLTDNPLDAPASWMSWYDMATGMRAVGLTCLASLYDTPPDWVVAGIGEHVRALSDPKLYAADNNHGLHQNNGLLALGCARAVPAWRDLAVSRASTMLTSAVDDQGVTNEGSISYQAANYFWYGALRVRLELCGLGNIPALDRVSRMPELLAYATQPDGTYVPFGDTSAVQPATAVAGTTAQYAATQGAVGPKPAERFAVFDRGYAFSRSGWFDTQTAAEQSLASLRFGPTKGPAVHGHQDAGNVGYYAYGTQILWQPGYFGGGAEVKRHYVWSNRSHNTVDVAGAAYDSTAVPRLVAAVGGPRTDVVTIDSTALEGTKIRRTMAHVRGPELLVVSDRVTQARSRAVKQRWHLGADRKVTRSGCRRVDTFGEGTNATILWVGGCPDVSIARGQTRPMLGWRSHKMNELTPAPTVTASYSGKAVQMTAVVVPRPAGTEPGAVSLVSSRIAEGAGVAWVRVDDQIHRVSFTARSASSRQARNPSRIHVKITGAAARKGAVRSGDAVKVRVRVAGASGAKVTGRVRLTVGRHVVVARLRDGVAVVPVRGLAAGQHLVKVTYPGSAEVAPSSARYRVHITR